jgi:2-polyprenyl-6-methoxyphenol hydroxylase-like FAD-dependent oxidoreductase
VKILVAGGGIGGLSATLALRRQGFDVDVIERDPNWAVYGVGIIQPGNALRALDALGLAEACVEAGHAIRGDRVWLTDGVTQVAYNEWPALLPHLPPGNGLPRPSLHEILTSNTLASGADVRTGVTAELIAPVGDIVDVTFSDGTAREYDLVIGADGLYSQVREEFFGVDRQPRLSGQVCWRYNLPRLAGLDEIWVFLGGNGGGVGLVPLEEDLMYLLINTPPDGLELEIEERGSAAVMRERLEPFGGPVAALRDLIVDDAAVVVRPLANILVPAPWNRGRVVLLGDAAHGTTPHCGQGAAQAIEDGIVLAEELARDVTVETALQAYVDRRFDRCRVVVEGSEQIGRWEQDQTLPIDPLATRNQVVMAVSAPI